MRILANLGTNLADVFKCFCFSLLRNFACSVMFLLTGTATRFEISSFGTIAANFRSDYRVALPRRRRSSVGRATDF